LKVLDGVSYYPEELASEEDTQLVVRMLSDFSPLESGKILNI
tara:strand:+ start:1230 stop:1355 length:126 start_codon:yes stop_codon:yes gene_type:complete